ncbi:hypothetical protein SBF1_4040003 [Candidatus Desulfosporosinus infrequens]|uniref:Uncharacterized protein n=1 Tax=Candidatus Desulfosporosinus infrequens TaxID=2043169 RepID=A0A2U3L8N6_9FIRM|nr:hypothetical protein SBF1_4040003 [Candidatus Desulfosporosinus infrequens]
MVGGSLQIKGEGNHDELSSFLLLPVYGGDGSSVSRRKS